MPSDRKASIYWYHSDSLVAPDGLTNNPFVKVGSGVVTVTDLGVDINKNVGGDPLYFYQQALHGDRPVSPSRQREDMVVQAKVTGISSAPGWGPGSSPIALWIDDGLRSLALSIGSELALIDPATGDVLWEITSVHPWLFAHDYAFRKFGSARWVVEVDGKTVATVPYQVSAGSVGSPAIIAAGCLDSGGTARAVFQGIEMACNRALASEWLIERMKGDMPIPMQTRWTEEARAWLRATAGLVQGAYDACAWLWADMQVDRQADETFELTGTVLPPDTEPEWLEVGGPTVTIVRERVRFVAPATAPDKELRCEFSAIPALMAGGSELRIGGYLTVRSYTLDAFGRIGPILRIRHLGRVVHAQLHILDSVPVWALTDGAVSAAPVALAPGALPRQISITREHHVAVHVIGEVLVLLLVDGVIVDRRPLAAFPPLAGDDIAALLVSGSAGLVPVCTMDLRGWKAERLFSDLSRRPLFEHRALEALMFTSGVDRNDELDTWVRHQQDVEGARGTTAGIVVEMRRLAVEHDNVFVTRDQEPGSWFLELSWPEVTPIYLELAGYFTDVYVEFVNNAPFHTSAELAELARRYLVPLSSEELTYHIAVITLLTAPMAVPGAGIWRATVVSTAEFAAGDVVIVRSPTNGNHASTTVIVVTTTTEMDLVEAESAVPYIANSVIRKVLATT